MHAQLDALLGALGDAEELDAIAELFRIFDVLLRQSGDALGVGALELHRDAERDRRKNRELVRGVDALDVERRVGFRVAVRLRVLQRGLEGEAFLAHLGQDEVRRAVDDAGDPFDAIRSQALAQRLDDRHAARHRRLEGDHHALLLRRREYFVAVRGEQGLVRGDDVLAVADCLELQVLGHGVAANQLDDDVDVLRADKLEGILGQLGFSAGDLLRAGEVLVGDLRDLDRTAGAAADLVGVAIQDVPGAAAYRADAEQPYAYRL